MASNISADAVSAKIDDLISALFHTIPSGVGKGGGVRKVSHQETDQVLAERAAWAVQVGSGRPEDLDHLEERGALGAVDPSVVSFKAKKRGAPQLGTLGSGNHFVEIQEVEEIYREKVAQAFGLFQGQLTLTIHSDSRGLGHQVCSEYVRSLQEAVRKYDIKLPDRQLVCAPLDSPEGQRYYRAMASAANYAWANRQCMAHLARRCFEEVLGDKVSDSDLRTVYTGNDWIEYQEICDERVD